MVTAKVAGRVEAPAEAEVQVEAIDVHTEIAIVVEKLTKNVTEAHLREIFGTYGHIESVDLPMNKQFMTNRGTAYIIFDHPSGSESAITHMHEAQLDGAVIAPDILDQGHRQVDLDHQEDQHLAAIEVHPQEEEDLGVADALPMTMDMAHAHTLDLYHQDLDGDPVRVLDHLLAVHLDDVEVHQVGVRRDEEDEVPVTVPGAALVAVDREAEAEVVHAAETDRAAGVLQKPA
ncbi:hypothetical protein B0A52_01551 [Exophiala mesophila]|uniref:RRM domain-containing protein n=1 Tax=Exophiala mesophila TaxID=212818 RepID=A0A438NFD8_EXOME|nr:hypothetical protein B0A52_01551 [Exophiala mesophila]